MSQTSILLVEDKVLIRMMLVEMVEELGHRVAAEAGSVEEGCSLAQTENYDLAILDINLQGHNVEPVAEVIYGRRMPFIFLSGYGSGGVPERFRGTPVLNKPCTAESLKRMIDIALGAGPLDKDQDKSSGQL